MKLRARWLALAALACAVAVVAVIASWTMPPQSRDVAASAPPAPRQAPTGAEAALGGYERERERLSALHSADLRNESERLHSEVSGMASERRRHIDEEGSFDALDVALYDSALRDLRSAFDAAYHELDNRGELTPVDEVARIEAVDVAGDREELEGSRTDRDRYAQRGRPSPDYPDELAIREAYVDMDAAMLRSSEARLRIAERDAEGRR